MGHLRLLAEEKPGLFSADLAHGLRELGGILGDLERHGDALDAAEESVAIFRRLAADRPNLYRPELAESLGRLAECHQALGRSARELEAVREMVEVHRRQSRSGGSLVDLARALDRLETVLHRLGRKEDAATALRETVSVLEGVAVERPQIEPRLMRALEILRESAPREDARD